jgi:hypothetical protein
MSFTDQEMETLSTIVNEAPSIVLGGGGGEETKKKSMKKYINKVLQEKEDEFNIKIKMIMSRIHELEGAMNGIRKKGKTVKMEKRMKNAYNIFLEEQIPVAKRLAPNMTHKEHFTLTAKYWTYMKKMKKNGDNNIMRFEDYLVKTV